MPIKYLDHSPLYSAIIEIRFKTDIPEDAVPGILYSKLQDDMKQRITITSLPAAQLPLALRKQDPNLKYAPTQSLMLENMSVNVGSNVLSLEANNARRSKSYPGWEEFFGKFKEILAQMHFISDIERIGIRYVNFFHEENFTEDLNIKLTTGWEENGQTNNSTIIFFVERNSLKSKVTIASDASIQEDNKLNEGQIIDVDTFMENGVPFEDLELRINEAHSQTKEIFYSLLGKKLLNKLGPHDNE